jgi:hypothetical protein
MPRRFYLLLSLATLVGACLRLWQLTAIPPGLHYDLAATALLGQAVAFDGYRPIFITAFTGHEALFYYWLGLWFRLIGSSVFALRLAAALLGVVTLPATFFAVREALRFEEHSLALAAFAATFLAFAFFHVTFSRFGFRVITQPLVQALALGFLFRGLHRSLRRQVTSDRKPVSVWRLEFGIWDFVLSGVFTGLAAYTYLAARLFPVPLAVFWLALIIVSLRRPSSVMSHLSFVIRSFALYFLSALLAFAPLGVYFLQHPDDFLNRASQVAPRPGEAGLLWQGIRRAAEMIFVNGEPYDRFNLPGLPLFGPVLGFFFVIGLLITLRNCARAFWDLRFGIWDLKLPTELLLLAWLPAMLLPTALAVHDIYPSNVRAFGLIPLLFVFPARGLLAGYRWLQSRWPAPLIPHAYPLTLVCLIALAAGSYSTGRNYFVAWANLPNQRLNNDADLTAIGAYLNAQDLADASVFVSAIHYRHPTLAYLARDFPSIRWLTGGASLAIPHDRAALYVFARSAPPPDEWIAAWEPYLVAAPLGPDNVPDFHAYRFEAGETPPLPQFTPLDENFGNVVTLTGYRYQAAADQILVDLRWRVRNPAEINDLLPYARLMDVWDAVWAQSGNFTYPSEQWSPGDTLLTRVTVPLPAGLPRGNYTLKAGLYSASTQTSLPHLDPNGGYAGERAVLAEIPLAGGPPVGVDDFLAANPMSAPASPLEPNPALTLLGYTLNTTAPRQGERLHLTLYWHAPRPVSPDPLTILLAGRPLYIGQPVHDTFPFWEWSPGQLVSDRYRLRLPPDFPPGPAELSLDVKGYGAATLATLNVTPVERHFTAPRPAGVTRVNFQDRFALYGFGLDPGPETTLTLFWQSLAPSDMDYTVFVHVLGASGQIVAQADAQPRGGAYPTSLWAPGEFVADPYTFHLAPGTYALKVGLYLSETGARLPVSDDAGVPVGDAVTLPAFQVP